MAGTAMLWVKPQWFDDNGNPCAGWYVFTYLAGTTTKTATYTDVALSVANTNPIILDSAGRATIFLDALSYKFVLAQAATDPPTSPLWTQDNVTAIPDLNTALDITGTAGEDLVANDWVYLSQGDGARTSGRWYKTDADISYASNMAGGLGVVQTAAIATACIFQRGNCRR